MHPVLLALNLNQGWIIVLGVPGAMPLRKKKKKKKNVQLNDKCKTRVA